MLHLLNSSKRFAASLLTGAQIFVLAQGQAQTFSTAQNNLNNSKFVSLPYGVAFVAGDKTPLSAGAPPADLAGPEYSLGTDVVRVVPTAGHSLYYITPNSSRVVKLFPLQAHEQAGLLDTPTGQLHLGSVTEPSISEDGNRIYFGYFPNAGDGKGNPSNSQVYLGSGYYYPKQGADLYVIDISAAKSNPTNFDPNQLPVTRLTQKTFVNGSQLASERLKDSMNPIEAAAGKDIAVINMHPVEMRGTDGEIKLVFVSNRRHLRNSNSTQGPFNDFNFNLFIADLDLINKKISNERQFVYYTTSSAISPIPLKDGIAFSYQGNVSENRQWHQQALSSAGVWSPLLGYGRGASSFHLGTYCIKNKGTATGEYFISTGYYNVNNQGFGSLHRLPLASAGLNELVPMTWGVEPRQVGVAKISNFTDDSNRDEWAIRDANGNFYGKGTTPMCARPDELLMAWTHTNANDKKKSGEPIPESQYDSFIGYRPNLEHFNPLAPVNLQTEEGLRILVDDTSGEFNLLFPVPALNWFEKTGSAQQSFSPPNIDPSNGVAAHEPFAVVGTSDLGNSDGTTMDCRAKKPFTPNFNGVGANFETGNLPERIVGNLDALTWIPPSPTGNTNDYCTPLKTADVFGIEISLTSNKKTYGTIGYQVDGGLNESAKLIGIYDRTSHDGSFKAMIPAKAPFQFHLLHKEYGLRLTDLKNWHSLEPGETRTNCGGCHGHDVDITPDPVPFAGTYADTHPAEDMVNKTPYVEYDPFCQPVMKVDTSPTRNIPVWQDLYSRFDQHCGSCHNSLSATNPQAAQAQRALSYTDEASAYSQLIARDYMGTELGALGSLAFMAARGKRTDGRVNTRPEYAPDYDNGVWGFRHSPHPNLCDGTKPDAAKWVYEFGLFIDHDSPRNVPGQAKNYRHDWYHPSVHSSLLDTTSCLPTALQVGFWDDTGTVKTQDVYVIKDNTKISLPGFPRAGAFVNGSFVVNLPALSNEDSIGVDVFDHAGNRQKYEQSLGTLIDACLVRSGAPQPSPSPSPSPSASPSPSPTPTASPTPSPSPVPEMEQLNLVINQKHFDGGDVVKFTVTSKGLSGKFVLAITDQGVGAGTTIYVEAKEGKLSVPVTLNKGKVLKRSLKAFNGFLGADQTKTFSVKLPKKITPGGTFHAQAIYKGLDSQSKPIKSNIVGFRVQELNSFGIKKSNFKNAKIAAFYGKKFKK